MSYCCDVLLISTLACQIADCLDDDELSLLAADTVLHYLLKKPSVCQNRLLTSHIIIIAGN